MLLGPADMRVEGVKYSGDYPTSHYLIKSLCCPLRLLKLCGLGIRAPLYLPDGRCKFSFLLGSAVTTGWGMRTLLPTSVRVGNRVENQLLPTQPC